MSGSSDKRMLNIAKEIKLVISKYISLKARLSSKKDPDIHKTFWNIRADLEILLVELKAILYQEDKMEKWQTKFQNELKGTKSKEKAKSILSNYIKDEKEVNSIIINRPKEGYKYLWKLKEVISSILEAFPQEKFVWINGEFKKRNDEIFEI